MDLARPALSEGGIRGPKLVQKIEYAPTRSQREFGDIDLQNHSKSAIEMNQLTRRIVALLTYGCNRRAARRRYSVRLAFMLWRATAPQRDAVDIFRFYHFGGLP